MNSVHNICQTCLSDGRQLYPLDVMRNLLPELERYIEEIKESAGGVCWECRSHILKFFKFKSNVRKAQNTMWDLKVNKQNGNISSISTLSVSHKQTYDYIYTSNEEMEIKSEPTFIKQETDIPDCEMDDVKTDIDIDETINFEFVNTEEKETIQNDDRNVIVSKQETSDDTKITYLDGEIDKQKKFSKVIFTEEEMQECREIKRSHPNFKTLELKCGDCVLGFKRKDIYDLHMKEHGLNAGSFLCDICKMRFSSDFELAHHRHKHYEGYKCKQCHYKCTMSNAIRGHCSSHHKVDTVSKIYCKYCKVIVGTYEKLTEHVEEKHTFSCDKCSVTLRRKEALRKHKRRIHGSKRRLMCDICTRTFANKARLESHMMTHDESIAKHLSYCSDCNVQYKSVNVYKDHLKRSAAHSYNFLRIHVSKKRLICGICAKTFTNKARLESHMVTHDEGIAKQLSYCAVCDIQYKSVNIYKDHLRKSDYHWNKLQKTQ